MSTPTAGGSTFPNSTYMASNYWVDPIFDTTVSPTATPTNTRDRPNAHADQHANTRRDPDADEYPDGRPKPDADQHVD